jgi:Fur family ferric uptake transcriptional regulator
MTRERAAAGRAGAERPAAGQEPIGSRSIRRLFREKGIVFTTQREQVLRAVIDAGKHIDAEELHRRLSASRQRVGLATVYRTLQMLREHGLVAENQFGERRHRYEQAEGRHHDHLVCLACGKVQEFEEPAIEQLQERVARRHGFAALSHRLELYGYCRACGRRNAP